MKPARSTACHQEPAVVGAKVKRRVDVTCRREMRTRVDRKRRDFTQGSKPDMDKEFMLLSIAREGKH